MSKIEKSVIDIETLKGLFTITFLDYSSDNVEQYIISPNLNQLSEIKEKLKKIKYFIGFNSIHFDSIVCNWLLEQKEVEAYEIYEVAQEIIHADFGHSYTKYKYNTSWINIDLFLYWSKMLRISKKMSLKFFAVNLGLNVEEMPIHHSKVDFTNSEIDSVLSYNLNDCIVTKALAVKLREQINLRISITNEYNLYAYSWDAPKIASELLLDAYCKQIYDYEYSNLSFNDFKKEIRDSRFNPISYRNGDYLPKIEFKTDFFKSLYDEICNSYNGFSKDILFKQSDETYIKISYGSGGIHSVNKEQYFKSNDLETIWTSDVESLYPTLLINNKFIRPELIKVLEIYSDKKEERIKAKKEGNKVVNETLKLVLNSTTGLLDNVHSWLYSPGQIMALRLTGQLVLTRLFEECYLNSLVVRSLNTDGIEVSIPKGKEEDYLKIIESIEKEFNLKFEHDKYKFIYYTSVNDYITQTEKGKIKVKGSFIYENVLDGSNEFLIIPLAVKEYFVNNIPVEETVKNNKDIFNFCCAKKIDWKYAVYFNGEKVQQLNRFYVSKKGAYLYKNKGKTMENVFAESAVQIYNKPTTEFPKDINYNFYINKAKEIIKKFEKEQLSLF